MFDIGLCWWWVVGGGCQSLASVVVAERVSIFWPWARLGCLSRSPGRGRNLHGWGSEPEYTQPRSVQGAVDHLAWRARARVPYIVLTNCFSRAATVSVWCLASFLLVSISRTVDLALVRHA